MLTGSLIILLPSGGTISIFLILDVLLGGGGGCLDLCLDPLPDIGAAPDTVEPVTDEVHESLTVGVVIGETLEDAIVCIVSLLETVGAVSVEVVLVLVEVVRLSLTVLELLVVRGLEILEVLFGGGGGTRADGF